MYIQDVDNLDNFKPFYEVHVALSKNKGCIKVLYLRNAKNPEQLVIITKREDMESTKNFVLDDVLRTVEKKLGFIGQPKSTF
jgi:heme-degrading monooxygenase HmoA